MPPSNDLPPMTQALAYPAASICVHFGVHAGEPLRTWEEVAAGDVYRLARDTKPLRLRLAPGAPHRLAADSDLGQAGDPVTLTGALTLVAGDGERVEAFLVRHDRSGTDLLLPLSPLGAQIDYTLIAAGPPPDRIPLADAICVAFASGTLIALPGAAPAPIDKLRPGMAVLTRDRGAQILRWIGKARFRAEGGFAPVVITAGTMGNLADLVVSPHHRLFLYRRGAPPGQAEILIQAKHLVDGRAIRRREGGFVDYYSLVFDRHEVIYAEGIACESLMVNASTLRLIPGDLSEDLRERFPGLTQSQHRGTETTAPPSQKR